MAKGKRRSMSVSWVARACGMVASIAALSHALPARAAEKMAVLVLGTSERDAELAENVTEMIVAAVAQRGGFEVAGKEEFRARLGVDNEQKAQACLDDTSCVGRTAVSLGVRRIVTGNVGTRGRQYLFSLNLVNVETGKVDNRVFRLIEGGTDELIRGVQDGTAELFKPKVEPGRIQVSTTPKGARVSIDNAYLGVTPLISGTLLPGAHRVRVESEGRFPWVSTVEVRSGQDLGVNLTETNLPVRRRWPSTAAKTTGVLALGAVATGGFLGVLSQLKPTGETRAEAQDDLDQKRRLKDGANIAFLSGAVLTAVTSGLVLTYWNDIFGKDDSTEE